MSHDYDLVILGGGIGGYSAAIRAATYGMKTAIVEQEKIGGTCLHQGCIPTKSFIESAHKFRQTKTLAHFGVEAGETKLNFKKVQTRTKNIVQTLHHGLLALIKKNKIDVFYGKGRILGASIFSPIPGTISVEYANGEENAMLHPKHILIATGSAPKTVPGLDVDDEHIMDSEGALRMETLPESILIIGGGVIGMEWASMLADFGVNVTVVEAGESILPGFDLSIVKEVEKQLAAKNITIFKSATVQPETLEKENGISIDILEKETGQTQTILAEKLLVAVGRTGNIHNIGLKNTEIVTTDGFIEVNKFYQTKETHIYAVGDVIGGKQLAHAAANEGIKAVEHMAGEVPQEINERMIPACVYIHPEIASIGLTEEEARAKDLAIKVGNFPFLANGKALIQGESNGFVKVIEDEETNDILGIHMIGPGVTDLIGEASLAQTMDATPWEISQAIHPHPSLSEALWEASLATDGKQIHF